MDNITITVSFDEAVQAIAYLSDLLEFLERNDFNKAARTQTEHVRTAKKMCEAFCCEHFQNELGEE